MKVTELLKAVDWKLLRKQKTWLLAQNGDSADGLVNLLDALQEAVVGDGIISEREVFH